MTSDMNFDFMLDNFDERVERLSKIREATNGDFAEAVLLLQMTSVIIKMAKKEVFNEQFEGFN